jgi:hypothetical protein
MGRSFLPAVTAALAGAFLAGTVHAGIPDPALSDVPNVVGSPGGTLAYQVRVLGSSGPVEGALVRLAFSAEAEALLCWCSGQTRPEIDAVSDAAGVATFHIAAGGCLDPAHLSEPPVQVFADGILLAEVGLVSPDVVDNFGLHPWQGWNPGTSCSVGLPDGVAHTGPVKTGSYSYCSDLDSDGSVGLLDAVLLTVPIKTGAFCPR